MYKIRIVMIVIFITLYLSGCSTQYEQITTQAKAGQVDLQQYQLTDMIVSLDGEWEYYWNQLLEPEQISQGKVSAMVNFPSSWNRYQIDDEKVPGFGYATYRLRFFTKEDQILSLKIPKVRTAYKLWMNGNEVAKAGSIGKSSEAMVPQYKPQIVSVLSKKGENEIVIQMSNYYMQSGGLLSSILLGSEEGLLSLRYKGLAYELFIFGALSMSGLYHLTLFFFRKKDRSALYFGIFGILIAVRTLFVGESFAFFAFPELSFNMTRKIQTLTYYLGIPVAFLFFREILPAYFHKIVARVTLMMGLVYTLVVVATPMRIYTAFNPIYQVASVILMGYIFVTLLRVASNREENSRLIVMGGIILILTGLMDTITLSSWINNSLPSIIRQMVKGEENSSAGLLIFTMLYSLLIAKKFTDSLERQTIMGKKLTEINNRLDDLVLQRTQALTEANRQVKSQNLELAQVNEELQKLSLKDPLTGLWNRRQYIKNVNLEWQRCLSLNEPISLLFIDVDFFKNYNDFYGHAAGDECLILIAKALRSVFLHPSHMAVRHGGEEFLILLGETMQEDAMVIAESVLKEIQSLHIPHERSPIHNCITVSIGVATIQPKHELGPEHLLKSADEALYQAKNTGRNKICFL